MDVLDTQITTLAGASIYGNGNYGEGLYGGAGTENYVVLYPQPFGIVWEPDSIIVNTDSVSFTQAAVYLDVTQITSCVGNSINGNQDTIDLPAVQITANHRLIVVWFGGDPGSTAFATLMGEEGTLYG